MIPLRISQAGESLAVACASCRFFRADPRAIEAAIPGLVTMGSGYAAVRSDDGLCDRHERYLPATSICRQYESQLPAARPPGF